MELLFVIFLLTGLVYRLFADRRYYRYAAVPAAAGHAAPLPALLTGALRFFQSHNPFYSPDGDYVWDSYHGRWIRRRSGGGAFGFIIGILIALVLLRLLGLNGG